jgi:GH25 family lysozyme M1 (1,4-beta-N-acetylmuramidase)
MSLNGIDISSFQTGIDMTVVPADFVIIKATQGNWYINPDCDRAYQQADTTGKLLGIFHYADGSGSPEEEADYFIDNIQGYIGNVLLALDWEQEALQLGPGWALAWLNHVQARTGIKPVIYMSVSVTREYDWSSVVSSDYGLWVAGYYAGNAPMGYNPDAPDQGVGYWPGYAIYQYTSSGQLDGYSGNIDLDVFYGDANAWLAYAGANTTPVAPTPTEPPKPIDPGDLSKADQHPTTDINNSPARVKYQAHVENIGWQEIKTDGQIAGTVGQSLRLEALAVESLIDGVQVDIEGHVQYVGWQEARSGKNAAGTTGGNLRLEAIKLSLSGTNAGQYTIHYCVHVQNIGWMDQVSDGAVAGTTGQSLRIEAVKIWIDKK